MQVGEIVNIGHDTAAGGIVFQIEQNPVHLIELPFPINCLLRQLIPVGLADRAVFVGPAVPDMRLQIADIIALFLPDPKQFVYTGLESSAADREYGKLLLQIVTVDNPEFFHRVRGSAVLPMRTSVIFSTKILSALLMPHFLCFYMIISYRGPFVKAEKNLPRKNFLSRRRKRE